MRDSMIVLDTNVMIDMVLESRPRHSLAVRLGKYLVGNDVCVRMPLHALLEIQAAIAQEKIGARPLRPGSFPMEGQPLRTDLVPIDLRFVERYSDPAIPYLRSGDFPFVAIAKVDVLPLITEDEKQREAAVRAGVAAYSIADYIAHVGA